MRSDRNADCFSSNRKADDLVTPNAPAPGQSQRTVIGGSGEFDELLTSRMRGQSLSDRRIDEVVTAELERFDTTIDQHAVWWNSQAWCDADCWEDAIRERLRSLAALPPAERHSMTGWRLISRADVFGRSAVGPIDLFLAAMVWGFGDRGYGWRRTADILRSAGEEGVTRAVTSLQHAASSGPPAAWRSWSPGGAAKLRGVGTAFASKIAYFACFDRTACTGPLIADANTAWALWALTGVWDSRTDATVYDEYVKWSEARGRTLTRRPDEIERALFSIGPRVREAWKRSSERRPAE